MQKGKRQHLTAVSVIQLHRYKRFQRHPNSQTIRRAVQMPLSQVLTMFGSTIIPMFFFYKVDNISASVAFSAEILLGRPRRPSPDFSTLEEEQIRDRTDDTSDQSE